MRTEIFGPAAVSASVESSVAFMVWAHNKAGGMAYLLGHVTPRAPTPRPSRSRFPRCIDGRDLSSRSKGWGNSKCMRLILKPNTRQAGFICFTRLFLLHFSDIGSSLVGLLHASIPIRTRSVYAGGSVRALLTAWPQRHGFLGVLQSGPPVASVLLFLCQ